MNQNIFNKFTNETTKKVFDNYEKIYNKKILDKFNIFNSSTLENSKLFNDFFFLYEETCKNNSKIFSKLKHE